MRATRRPANKKAQATRSVRSRRLTMRAAFDVASCGRSQSHATRRALYSFFGRSPRLTSEHRAKRPGVENNTVIQTGCKAEPIHAESRGDLAHSDWFVSCGEC